MTNDQLCTAADRLAIVQAAANRANFLAWLARALLRTDDLLIREEASQAILQLIGASSDQP